MLRIKILFLLMLFLLCNVAFSASSEDSNDYARITLQKKRRIESVILEYKAKVNEIAVTLFNLDDKIGWLNMKMAKIEDQKRDIPDNLRKAIIEFKLKKTVVTNELNRINSLLEKKEDELKQLGSKVELLNGGKKPSWWPISPEEKEKIAERRKFLLLQKQKQELETLKQKDIAKKDIAKKDEKKGSAVVTKIKESNINDLLIFEEQDDYIILSNKLPILFPSGGVKISNTYKKYIKKISTIFKQYNIKSISTKGYADTNRSKKDKVPNYRYGYLRAANVASEFVKNGLKESLITISSMSDKLAKGKTEAQKTLDRKVTIQVYVEK